MKKELGFLALGAIIAGTITGGFVHAQSNNATNDTQLDPTVCQRMHDEHGFGFGADKTEWLSEQASILGMTTEDLQTALDAGQNLQQIAETKGISPEQIHEAMQASMKEQLANLVADGSITQEQADLRLERMSAEPTGPKEFGKFKGSGFGKMMHNN